MPEGSPVSSRIRHFVRCSLSALLCLGGTPILFHSPAIGAPPAAIRPADLPSQIAESMVEAAQRFRLPTTLITAVINAESGGEPRAVSRSGALGLMQVMPATWAYLTKRYGLGDDPFDARANILAGAAYLREMLDRFGDAGTALAAYNAGPGRVEESQLAGRRLPLETTAYVASILPSINRDSDHFTPQILPSWREAAVFAERTADRWRDRSPAAERIGGGETDTRVGWQQDAARRAASLFASANGMPGR